MKRTAVVLLNLGGPDSLEAVRPFLFNLFNDPAILRRPQPLRWLLAKAISGQRARTAMESYRRIGGRSPLLEETRAQADALERALGAADARVFVCMRYWHPMAAAVVDAVGRFDPETIVLLPLYPQFSSSTTASSLRAWREAAAARLDVPTVAVCCYPELPGFIEALAGRVADLLDGWSGALPRILYSAHGLPRTFVERGDPYQSHVERTVAAIRARLGRAGLEDAICYQSRVGPLEWLGPYTDAEIRRAGAEGRAVVVVPVAFVSEHSETLVELDMDYRALAEASGVPRYERVATVGTAPAFIEGLAGLVRSAANAPCGILPPNGARICAARFTDCPVALGAG